MTVFRWWTARLSGFDACPGSQLPPATSVTCPTTSPAPLGSLSGALPLVRSAPRCRTGGAGAVVLGSETDYIDPSRCLARTLLLLPLLLLGSALAAERAAAAGDGPAQAEVGFAHQIGQERSARGIGGVVPASDLQTVARRHAQRMADRGEPYHNPNLGAEVQGWSVVSENVGAGSNVAQIHDAFMASRTHRDIILNGELIELGVGVVEADGQLWVVEVFRRPSQAAAGPPQPAAPLPGTDQAPSTAPSRHAVPPTTVASPPDVTTAPPPPPPTTMPEEDLTGRGNGAVALGVIAAVSPRAVPVPHGPQRGVPGVAWVAAALLVGVVAFQIKALRSSTLLG